MSTASALEREMRCPPSAVLPTTVQESGEDAERGHEIHGFIRSVASNVVPRSIALARLGEGPTRETCEQIDFEMLCGDLVDVRAEVAYRITTHGDEDDTIVELGLNLGRRYPPREENDTDGTNDIEGWKAGEVGRLRVVRDIKTGWYPVTPCRDNPQMQWHARAQMLRFGVDRVEAAIVYVGVGGELSFDTYVFTRLELDTFADDLIARKARIARANELLKAGQLHVNADDRWCRWCHAKMGCPKFTSLARAMGGDIDATRARYGTMTLAQKAAIYEDAVRIRDVATMIVDGIRDLARTEPLPLPGNKVLKETGTGVRVVNAPKPDRRRRVA